MSSGIIKFKPNDQILYNRENIQMEDDKTLQEYGITMASAKAQAPCQLGLALRSSSGDFEMLEMTPYSAPPDLPEVMKNTEASNGQEQA